MADFPIVAVLGTGSIGLAHVRALRERLGLKVVAVPARGERRGQLAEQGIDTAPDVATAAEMGARACVIATDTGRHLDDARAALRAGCHLLVEKPMTPDARAARELRAAAIEAGRRVAVGYLLRFSASLNAFRARLPEIGALHGVRVECQSYLPDWRPDRDYRASYSARRDEGGVLRDLIHEIDYAGWLFGWPAALHARVLNLGRLGIEGEEHADLAWEAAGGVPVSMTLDYLSRPSRRIMRASGAHGTLTWDGIEGAVTLALAGRAPIVTRHPEGRDDWLAAQDRAFVEAIAGAVDARLATAEDGVSALDVCDAARRASATRREEPVECR